MFGGTTPNQALGVGAAVLQYTDKKLKEEEK
jgi:hypothetical protein